MLNRKAENFVNYQQRAQEFVVGDVVVPYGHSKDLAGRVTSVWPAIGMVDVEFAMGNKRYPVEDLQLIEDNNASPPFTDSTPGGGVHVAATPKVQAETSRVAHAFVKKSLYWNGVDRKYRATKPEADSGHYCCPKCRRRGIESILKPAVYKRREQNSEKLLGCPECLFLIKRLDISNDPTNLVETD